MASGLVVGSGKCIEFGRSIKMGATRGRFFNYDELKYNESWDWLMPVVEKIESFPDTSIVFEVENLIIITVITNKTPYQTKQFSNRLENLSKIEAVYKVVIDFINWHNKNKTI